MSQTPVEVLPLGTRILCFSPENFPGTIIGIDDRFTATGHPSYFVKFDNPCLNHCAGLYATRWYKNYKYKPGTKRGMWVNAQHVTRLEQPR